MTSRILQEMRADKVSQHMPFPVLQQIFPRELVCQILSDLHRWEKRERKLNHLVVMYVLIAWTLVPTTALKRIWSQLIKAVEWLSVQAPSQSPPQSSAWCYRRQTLGVGPLRELAKRACRPLCHPQTPGAFCFGRRLLAIDSKLFDVCETAENDRIFRGRTPDGCARRRSPFPQLRVLSALEIGSHAHMGAVLAPGFTSELSLVKALLPCLPACSLVLQDSGFRAAWWFEALKMAGHETIARLQANEYACKGKRLSDGSYLVHLLPSKANRLHHPLTLRIIEYRLDPEIAEELASLQRSRGRDGTRAKVKADQVYRLATTLLDPIAAPAAEIAACYHERWELELVYDEIQEHQMSSPVLMSRTVQTVLQEAWAMILGHYAVRAWMMQAAQLEPILDVDRLSFTQALSVLGTGLTLSEPLQQVPTERWKPRLLQSLREPGDIRPPERRMRSYPRVIKTASTRFFVKRDKDRPFVHADKTKTWKDFVRPLHCVPSAPEILLI
jgi:Insertion element 4 transposase N-terminal